MTVAHPSKYFTSTPKKLIQFELMLLGAAVIAVIDICVFSQAFCCFCAPNVIWLHSFMNRQYDRGPPIKILHKYPERRSSIQLELKLFGGDGEVIA